MGESSLLFLGLPSLLLELELLVEDDDEVFPELLPAGTSMGG